MSTLELQIELPEYATSINCSLLRLPRALFVWAGAGGNFGYLSMGIPTRDAKNATAAIVLDNSSRASQLSARLAMILKLQVFVSGDISDEADHIWKGLEERIKEEIVCNDQFFVNKNS